MGEEVTDINEILAVINNIQVIKETHKANNNNKQLIDESAKWQIEQKTTRTTNLTKNDFAGQSNTTQPKSSRTGTAGENDDSTKKWKKYCHFPLGVETLPPF